MDDLGLLLRTDPVEPGDEVRLEELSGPLASRPKLVFGIHGSGTPFQDRFELLPESKDERSRAAQSLDAILANRPATHT